MSMHFVTGIVATLLAGAVAFTQQTAPSSKPTEHVIGTISALDPATRSITIKEDKTGTEDRILVGNTRTLLKVAPGAKDLKSATRIQADDLAVGDRVDVRGFKAEGDASAIAARSVVLMSARDLEQAHQAQAAEWQHSSPGIVTAVDPAAGKFTIMTRTPEGPKPVTVATSNSTQFTRYSPDTPQTPVPSQLAQLQVGDQVRIIGSKSNDGSTMTADKIYSGAFRTISGTILSVTLDEKSIAVRDLSTKKPVTVAVNNLSVVRKLPPSMAAMLARRFNPNSRPGQNTAGASRSANEDNSSGAPPEGAKAGESGRGQSSEPRAAAREGIPPAGTVRTANSEVSEMLEKLPKIELAELKPGDAVVISGVATGADDSQLLATNIVAGVEPILQSAPNRAAGQSLGGDWGLGEMQVPQ
jgi:hypothetical protein